MRLVQVFHPDSLCFDDGSEHAVALHHSDWVSHPSSLTVKRD